MNSQHIKNFAKLLRYYSLTATTRAGSGHPTSSLSAADIAATLFFGGYFRFDVRHPRYENNDRLIFSKGHASPLFYAVWAAAGVLTERELLALRRFTSPLEGHPTMRFPYTEAATGSLGQGLSIGAGMALAAKLRNLSYRTFVLLGDSEMAEGSVWEAVNFAAYHKLTNLVAIVDVNRLGQRGATMFEYDTTAYKRRFKAAGWDVVVADGHSIEGLQLAFDEARRSRVQPFAIIAKTVKGKGVSFLENKDGWHGRALTEQELHKALPELGPIDRKLRGQLTAPRRMRPKISPIKPVRTTPPQKDEPMSTRMAYGQALVRVAATTPNMLVLDAEVSNSTYADIFARTYPKRYLEMFIAEQNMVGAAVGLSRRGFKPFVSTFAAFLTRAFDQIRMARYSDANIVFSGSHAGVSIGQDGPSQMGLEDIAMFRSVFDSVVLYPSDAVATMKLVAQASKQRGIVYIRTTRQATPHLYPLTQSFPIGGSKVLKQSRKDIATIVAAGITVHEALAAYQELRKQKINVRVIDAYSVKPIDARTLRRAAQQTKHIIVVEDHVPQGGIGDAVREALDHTPAKVYSLAVRKVPRSGTPAELLEYEDISASAIVKTVRSIR